VLLRTAIYQVGHRSSLAEGLPKPSGGVLIGRFCMGKRAVLSAVSMVHPSKRLEGFLFKFSGPGEGGIG